ncbi:MAG TPA: hypothetical protein VFH78_13880 [Candidatus Thermoplasmatota archaeon]|nr:hypothetical protein [Candidatus Thermoplasmatota archaeon]
MQRRLALLVTVAVLLAGCSARGSNPENDPWAYTKKPLYAGGFDLARVAGETDSQVFRVTDGSIAAIRVMVWINATAGGATVRVFDPSGNNVLTTSETIERQYGLQLGEWRVEVDGQPESAGIIHILAVRG